MANINSFAENINKIVKNTNNQIALLNGLQESVTTENATVSFDTEDSEGNTTTMAIPSWNAMNKKITALTNSINSLLNGEGVVSVGDGTSRNVEMTNIASVPDKITGLASPTTFNIDANWWFEDMMYPAAQVSIDLIGKIDDNSDRVQVCRVILDATDSTAVNFYHSSGVENSTVSYEDLVALLTQNGITYTEDKEVLDLPLSKVNYQGNFVIDDVEFVNGVQWYKLDSLQYKVVSESDDNQYSNSVATLKAGDQVSCGNYLYDVAEVNADSLSVRLNSNIGNQIPQTGQELKFYNKPWQTKIVNVKFSNNEIDFVYFKGINENFNIVANEWSEPIMFITNDLVYNGDNATDFNTYYNSYIVDWGQQFIDEVKERNISAAKGITPTAPSLNASDFSVVQINTQVNASLDSAQIISMKADIETTKSRLTSLQSTINHQQTLKQTTTDEDEYNKLSDQLTQNINDYKQLQASYRTSLDTILSLLKENNAVDVSPKYHIRGFFAIPASAYNNGVEQKIIGFETQYRYIKEDSTGVDLKTYTYTDQSGVAHTGVYSDWNIVEGVKLEKVYDSTQNKFVWQTQNISDGTEININQIDIAITKGEKVEFRVRSISEAGYPTCPLKSAWSNSVVIDFPSSLMTTSDIDNLVTDIDNENINIIVEKQLESNGIETHMDDSQANINSVNGTYFKHQASNISYEYKDPDTNEVKTISVQEALDSIFAFMKAFMDYSDGKTVSPNV